MTRQGKFSANAEWTQTTVGGLVSWWPPIVEKRGSTQNGRRTRCNGLCEMKKKDEEKRMKLEHPKLVGNMIKSAEVGTGLLHKVTKPTAGRVQILKEEEEDAKPSATCEETRKEWAKHWQCDVEVQHFEDRPWRNEEWKSLEEGTPRLKEKELEKAATTC